MCKSTVILTILCSICFGQAQSVALSGVVKLSNGTPVEGVRVSLAAISSLSILTKEDGTFSLKNTGIRVTSVPSTPLNWHFTLQENSILFTPTDLNAGLLSGGAQDRCRRVGDLLGGVQQRAVQIDGDQMDFHGKPSPPRR